MVKATKTLKKCLTSKDTACGFKQILEAAALQLLTSNFTNHTRWARHAGHCWKCKDKLINNILVWSPTQGHTSAGWPTKTYIYQFCADTKCHLENLLIGMVVKESRKSVLLTHFDDVDNSIKVDKLLQFNVAPITNYVVHSISFQTFFVQAFKIIVDSWKFTMLLLYISWDDWPIFWFQVQMNSYSSNWNTPY